MKIDVFIERIDKHTIIKAQTIHEIMKKLAINPQTVIIVKNSELITEDEPLKDKDEIKFLSVISGG
mgnify:FL=1